MMSIKFSFSFHLFIYTARPERKRSAMRCRIKSCQLIFSILFRCLSVTKSISILFHDSCVTNLHCIITLNIIKIDKTKHIRLITSISLYNVKQVTLWSFISKIQNNLLSTSTYVPWQSLDISNRSISKIYFLTFQFSCTLLIKIWICSLNKLW